MMPRFILASNSPRRKEILTMLGMEFEVIVSDCDESVSDTLPPDTLVCELAHRKAQAVLSTISYEGDFIVLGADTIVFDGNRVLCKPSDADDAFNTLMSLSDREHFVYTGVCLIGRIGGKTIVSREAAKTKVLFNKLNESEVSYYVKTGSPLDKAGSYGIQGFGGIFVKELHGDYYNVVGLPISLMREMLYRDFSLGTEDYLGKVK